MREKTEKTLDKTRFLHYLGIHKSSYAILVMKDSQDRVLWGLILDQVADDMVKHLDDKGKR